MSQKRIVSDVYIYQNGPEYVDLIGMPGIMFDDVHNRYDDFIPVYVQVK